MSERSCDNCKHYEHYEERVELCDHVLQTSGGTYHCELEKGHHGHHYWSDETRGVTWPTRPGFTSNVCATEVLAPFEKAWKEYSAPSPGANIKTEFRAGWRTRGNAIKSHINSEANDCDYPDFMYLYGQKVLVSDVKDLVRQSDT